MDSKYIRNKVQWISGGMKQKMADGGKVSDSSHSGLNGERKFLTCTGSYVCNNSTCTKLTSEGVKFAIISSRQKVGATLATHVGTMSRKNIVVL